MTKLTRFIPITIIALALITFFALEGDQYISLTTLQTHHLALKQWKDANLLLAALTFMGIYIIAVAISVPGAFIFTLIGGYLFGPIIGTLLVIASATIGATCFFLAARTALGDTLEKKAGNAIQKMKKGFQENAMSYLLFLRLVPLFPFWLINIAPAILNVNLRTFIIATFFGIIPGTFVYVLIGNGLGAILAKGGELNPYIIFTPPILAPVTGLALLSLVPILYKKYKHS